MPFDFNVDVRLNDDSDPQQTQYINLTIEVVTPGVQQLSGTWRGASVFVPSSSGEFLWDGRPDQMEAFVYDGPVSGGRFIMGLNDFTDGSGGLPPRGASGGGAITDPVNPTFLATITWEIT